MAYEMLSVILCTESGFRWDQLSQRNISAPFRGNWMDETRMMSWISRICSYTSYIHVAIASPDVSDCKGPIFCIIPRDVMREAFR